MGMDSVNKTKLREKAANYSGALKDKLASAGQKLRKKPKKENQNADSEEDDPAAAGITESELLEKAASYSGALNDKLAAAGISAKEYVDSVNKSKRERARALKDKLAATGISAKEHIKKAELGVKARALKDKL